MIARRRFSLTQALTFVELTERIAELSTNTRLGTYKYMTAANEVFTDNELTPRQSIAFLEEIKSDLLQALDRKSAK